MDSLGKMMVILGLTLAVFGALVWWLGKSPSGGLLPGDIMIERGHTRFFFPIVTCIVVSLVLTVLLRLFNR